jgi:hypothetical protein
MARNKHRDPARPMLQKIAARGTIIADGFRVFHGIAPDASEESFKAGAAYLFQFMLRMMDEHDEPTTDDLGRMETLDQEVSEIDTGLMLKYGASSRRT